MDCRARALVILMRDATHSPSPAADVACVRSRRAAAELHARGRRTRAHAGRGQPAHPRARSAARPSAVHARAQRRDADTCRACARAAGAPGPECARTRIRAGARRAQPPAYLRRHAERERAAERGRALARAAPAALRGRASAHRDRAASGRGARAAAQARPHRRRAALRARQLAGRRRREADERDGVPGREPRVPQSRRHRAARAGRSRARDAAAPSRAAVGTVVPGRAARPDRIRARAALHRRKRIDRRDAERTRRRARAPLADRTRTRGRHARARVDGARDRRVCALCGVAPRSSARSGDPYVARLAAQRSAAPDAAPLTHGARLRGEARESI
ncbi:hypothetical protein BDI4_680003 [Burkholderia diffusa]|nr:hypothetical protein BDI4_680003 [Burkholderia diffusa]